MLSKCYWKFLNEEPFFKQMICQVFWIFNGNFNICSNLESCRKIRIEALNNPDYGQNGKQYIVYIYILIFPYYPKEENKKSRSWL